MWCTHRTSKSSVSSSPPGRTGVKPELSGGWRGLGPGAWLFPRNQPHGGGTEGSLHWHPQSWNKGADCVSFLFLWSLGLCISPLPVERLVLCVSLSMETGVVCLSSYGDWDCASLPPPVERLVCTLLPLLGRLGCVSLPSWGKTPMSGRIVRVSGCSASKTDKG